jgi:lipopolysaccharide export LptBFGC system permease protein LptF
VLRPVLALTAIFVLALVWVQERVAPSVALDRDRLEAHLMDKEDHLVLERVSMRDFDGRLFVAHGFHMDTGLIEHLLVSFTDGQGRLVHVSGDEAIYDEAAGGWRLLGGGTSEVRMAGSMTPVTGEAAFVPTDIRPDDLLAETRDPFDLPYGEILRQAERYPQSRRYHLLRHYHVTFPLSVLLLVLLALPFVLRVDTRKRMAGLGVSILLCVGFLVMDAMVRDLGTRGFLQPVLAAWLPAIVTGSLVTVLFDAVDR